MIKGIKVEDWKDNKTYHEYRYTGDPAKYNEAGDVLPTSRVLDGSEDDGYMAEYKGYGSIGTIPVIAIYLLEWDEKDIEDEEDYDWDRALENGRIIIDIDALTDDDYATIRNLLDTI
mgnify:CR=1 FL=1